LELAKKAAGEKAASLIHDGMIVGLGTGSTTRYFLEALSRRNLRIKCGCTSKRTEELAKELNLLLVPIEAIREFDVDVDGADQIDKNLNMIKGGGGALLREKIVAKASKKMIVLIDPSKRVQKLGGRTLPIEIAQFGAHFTIAHIEDLGYTGALRKTLTDNGNLIFDIDLKGPLSDPESLNAKLLNIPGVLETGLFLGMATEVIEGNEDGSVKIYDKNSL